MEPDQQVSSQLLWMTHIFTAAGAFLIGVVLPFVTKLRQQGVLEWQAIVQDLRGRVQTLEAKGEEREKKHDAEIRELTQKHGECERHRLEDRRKIDELRSQIDLFRSQQRKRP